MSRPEDPRRYRAGAHEILVGRGAAANDHLTFRLASRGDVWLHAEGFAGSHVVVRNPQPREPVPRDVIEVAARLAAWHSKAREAGGKVAVTVCPVSSVSKRPGAPAGQVVVRGGERLRVYPGEPSSRGPGSESSPPA